MPNKNKNGIQSDIGKYISGNWNCICSKCNIQKSITDFYLHSNKKPRKQCKSCHYAYNKFNSHKYKHLHLKWNNEHKELCLQRTKEWRKRNLTYDCFRSATRRALKKQRTPVWANLEKIKQVYLNCPKGLHVDHIIPLKGLKASGLHVENNLQYLTPSENFSKRNRFGWENAE